MKLGFDAKRLYNNFTGLGNYSRTLLQNLYSYFPENEFFLYTTKIKKSGETQFFSNHSGITTIVPETNFKSYWRTFSILENLKNDNIEIFHGLSHELPHGIQNSAVKSVVTIHDLIFKKLPGNYSFFDTKIYDFKFKSACKRADKIIAISESTKNDIIDNYAIEPEKIEVIYQACNPVYYNLPVANKNNYSVLEKYKIPNEYMLYVGSIVPRKNLLSIVKSYRLLPDDLKIPLVVIGNGKSYKEKVYNFLKKSRLEHLVIWIDSIANNGILPLIYQNAKVFIYPSEYEGFGIPVIEALLSKTPVITSNTSSLPEAAGPGSFQISPSNVEELAFAIEKTLSDSNHRKKMIAKGYQYAKEKFDPQKVTGEVFDLYKSILDKR